MSAAREASPLRGPIFFAIIAAALLAVGYGQSWSVAFGILNLCLISSIMALGVNMQWGYAGLFNVGTMGFAAVGGMAAVLVSVDPVAESWSIGGAGLALALLLGTCIASAVRVGSMRRSIATVMGWASVSAMPPSSVRGGGCAPRTGRVPETGRFGRDRPVLVASPVLVTRQDMDAIPRGDLYR